MIGTLWKSRYKPDRSVRGPGGHQRGPGPRGRVVGVSGAVIVLVLKGSMRGIRGWFYFFCTTLGSPSGILVLLLKCTLYGENGHWNLLYWVPILNFFLYFQ